MVFLTKYDFIVGANNPPGQMVTWVNCNVQFKKNVEMNYNGNNTNENYVAIHSTLEGKNKNCRAFNGMDWGEKIS